MIMKKYMIYMDDGEDCFKVPVPAENEDLALRYVRGNGEVIAIRDATEEYPISSDKVRSALKSAGFGLIEINLIMMALESVDICNPLY